MSEVFRYVLLLIADLAVNLKGSKSDKLIDSGGSFTSETGAEEEGRWFLSDS